MFIFTSFSLFPLICCTCLGFFYACVPHYPNKRVCIYCLGFLFAFLSQHLLFLLNTCFYSWTLSSAAFVDILKAEVQVFLWVHIIPTPWQLSLNSAALLWLPEFHIVIVTCSQLWLTHHVDDFGYNRKLLPVLKHGLLTKHDAMYKSRYSPQELGENKITAKRANTFRWPEKQLCLKIWWFKSTLHWFHKMKL